MAIHWFPGHMATAKREIRAAMPSVDLVIEVLDARIPFSSENPLVDDLRGDRPSIHVLNKADLADPAVTEEWLRSINARPGVRALAHQRNQAHLTRTVLDLARSLVGPVQGRPLCAMILGVPNVGKSTLINALAGRTVAKSENRPAVTTTQQRVKVGNDLALLDTPGFLWPRLTPEACGYRLALTGAIADRVLNLEEVADFAARFLCRRYPDLLTTFYGLDPLPPPEALMEAVGRRRGFLWRGGVVDLQRAAERLVHDFRDGKLGRITLETPREE